MSICKLACKLCRFVFNWVRRFAFLSVYLSTIFWLSTFIYVIFYNYYIPPMFHRIPLNFQFDTRCKDNCPPPYATFPLTYYGSEPIFCRGQPYNFMMTMKMPESEVNWDQGVFMVKLEIFDSNGKVITSSSTSSMLRYKSPLTRGLSTFVWPAWLFSDETEEQELSFILLKKYVERRRDNVGPANMGKVSIEAWNIQLYEATLLIEVNLRGLRYFMVFWPLTSAFMGILTLVSFFCTITLWCLCAILTLKGDFGSRFSNEDASAAQGTSTSTPTSNTNANTKSPGSTEATTSASAGSIGDTQVGGSGQEVASGSSGANTSLEAEENNNDPKSDEKAEAVLTTPVEAIMADKSNDEDASNS